MIQADKEPLQQASAEVDWTAVSRLIDAHIRAKQFGYTTGTSNWGAMLWSAIAPPVQPASNALKSAREIGENGTPHSESERLLFEEYMQGHSWKCDSWVASKAEYYDPTQRILYAVFRARAAIAQPAQPTNLQGGKTGWAPGLLQDDSKGLSRWLSQTPNAKQDARDAAQSAKPELSMSMFASKADYEKVNGALPVQPAAKYHVEYRTNACTDICDDQGHVHVTFIWDVNAHKRAELICGLLNSLIVAQPVPPADGEMFAIICDAVAAEYGGVAEGPFVTDFGKHTHQSMAAGAMNCAAAIRNIAKPQEAV